MKKMIIAAALVIAVLGAAFFYLKSSGSAVQYTTQKPLRCDIRETVSATGTVNAVTTVLVGTQVSGTIQKLYADYNSMVKEGQILALIDPASFEAQVAQSSANLLLAEANLEKAKIALRDTHTNFERNKILFEKNFVSKSDLDASETAYLSAAAQIKASEAQVAQARASLQLAQTNLRYTKILSPVNGTVISRSVDVGQTVAASFQTPTLFTIAQDLTQMQIDASIDEADIGRIKAGGPVAFTVDAYPEMTFKGNVSEIRNAPTTVQNVVTYSVIVKVDNPELKLKPGMTTSLSFIVADKNNVLCIPNAALRVKISDPKIAAAAPKGTGVWVLKNKKPGRVFLTTGISDNRNTEVISGDISEHAEIIVEVREKNQKQSVQPGARPGPRF
ncbi:MAG: efflux RND transporter periplasmic adaptor subunit [Smithella sp.]|nr:efflux RND transporter periplasmic adaptor subunit [Smithella sp.]